MFVFSSEDFDRGGRRGEEGPKRVKQKTAAVVMEIKAGKLPASVPDGEQSGEAGREAKKEVAMAGGEG